MSRIPTPPPAMGNTNQQHQNQMELPACPTYVCTNRRSVQAEADAVKNTSPLSDILPIHILSSLAPTTVRTGIRIDLDSHKSTLRDRYTDRMRQRGGEEEEAE